jgi:recombination protein RecT
MSASTQLATARQNAQLQNIDGAATSRTQQVREMITTKFADKIADLLPSGTNKLQFLAGLATAIQKNPGLLECTDTSLLSAAMMCASYGMAPNTPSGEAWIIKYYDKNSGTNQAQFQLGYQGVLKLVYESDYVAKADAREVREGDEFDYHHGTDERLYHKPLLSTTDETGKERPITHVYGMVYLKSGAVKFEVYDIPKIEAIRARSKSPSKGPWVTDWLAMAKKSALIGVTKHIPKSSRLSRVPAEAGGYTDSHIDTAVLEEAEVIAE